MKDVLLALPGWAKRIIVSAVDTVAMFVSLTAAFYLRLDKIVVPATSAEWLTFLAAPAFGLICLGYAGAYRLVVRDIGSDGLRRIGVGLIGSLVAWGVFTYLLSISIVSAYFVPRTVAIGYLVFAFVLISASRLFAYFVFSGRGSNNSFLRRLGFGTDAKRRALVVGYEFSTPKVARQIAFAGDYKIVGIIHDDPTMQHRKVDGLKIYPPEDMATVMERNEIEEVFLLASRFSAARRVEIIKQVGRRGVPVKLFPTFSDIESGRVNVSDLRPINVMQLLGRDPVPPIDELLNGAVRGKTVMITGAGGSIGSELARMTWALGPTHIILFDISETALYTIEQELIEMARLAEQEHGAPLTAKPEVVAVLGSVCSTSDLDTVFATYAVDVIYHAAAYKHVPIVEFNMAAGVRNNTFGTRNLARMANDARVGQFIMISTDKAVRPTNVMGASKRLAEIVLQGMADDPDTVTRFSMVRFGNVLGSSGSVVPRFSEQIASGGPITVTHPDIVRYFMSIPEAVQLVIQTGAMAEQGALYVLDMGEPVKIVDLAKAMINLAGLSERNDINPTGDIAIDFIGLREGEKLYEELLIDGNSIETRHSRIRRQVEPPSGLDELARLLDRLERALEQAVNNDEIQGLIAEAVDEYVPWPTPKVIPFRPAAQSR